MDDSVFDAIQGDYNCVDGNPHFCEAEWAPPISTIEPEREQIPNDDDFSSSNESCTEDSEETKETDKHWASHWPRQWGGSGGSTGPNRRPPIFLIMSKRIENGQVFLTLGRVCTERKERDPMRVKQEQLKTSFWDEKVPNLLNQTSERPLIST